MYKGIMETRYSQQNAADALAFENWEGKSDTKKAFLNSNPLSGEGKI